ncbi:MAG: hypothetical protein ACI31S_04335 [Bacilli bacterium]
MQVKTEDYVWTYVTGDNNYIVVYSHGCTINQIPLNIGVAYNIKNRSTVNLENKKVKVLLEYMFISKKGFDIATVISFINNKDLEVTEKEEVEDFIYYLTSGNKDVTYSEILDYVLKAYLELTKYMNIKEKMSIVEYRQIVEEFDTNILRFHIMPQVVEELPNCQINLEEVTVEKRSQNKGFSCRLRRMY